MALIQCKECGGKISTRYEGDACPHCGYPLESHSQCQICPDCQATNGLDATMCSSCGCPLSGNNNVSSSVDISSERYSKHWPLSLVAVVSIMAYLISSVVICNLLHSDSIRNNIETDIVLCGLICWITSCIIAKSNIDRLIYLIVIFLGAWICYENWESLGYGTVFISYGIQITLLVIASYKRYHPTVLGQGNSILAYVFASPLVILLALGEFAGSMNFSKWIIEGQRASEWLSQLLIVLVCVALNTLFLRWLFKKQIDNTIIRNKAFRTSIFVLISIAIIAIIVGLSIN